MQKKVVLFSETEIEPFALDTKHIWQQPQHCSSLRQHHPHTETWLCGCFLSARCLEPLTVIRETVLICERPEIREEFPFNSITTLCVIINIFTC